MKSKLQSETAALSELAKIKADDSPYVEEPTRKEIRSFSLDEDNSSDTLQRSLLVIILLLAVYGVVMSTYAVISIASTDQTCVCSADDVESALTTITKKEWFPTSSPTIDPSRDPTASPSDDPTLYPSDAPTLSPSANPTLLPSNDPTVAPTLYPSNDPTVRPTDEPTVEPTVEPTFNPSSQPSVALTMIPTLAPTSMPSSSPYIFGWAHRDNAGNQDTSGHEIQLIFPTIDVGHTGNLRNEYNTADGIFTAPITGFYAFSISAFCGGCSGQSHIYFSYNGIRHQSFAAEHANGIVLGSIVMQITEGDAVGFVLHDAVASAKTVYVNWYHTFLRWILVQEL